MARDICSIDGCDKKARTLGWCSAHYERHRVHGDVNHVTDVKLDLLHHRYGRLLVVDLAPKSRAKQIRWLCLCDCGSAVAVQTSNLRSGHTQSCGCVRAEMLGDHRRTHAMSGTPTYISWVALRRRCSDANYHEFHLYGGRGIRVCQEWQGSFETFLRDMGHRPQGKSIDRYPNPDGDYEPGNCCWATPQEQRANLSKGETDGL